MILSLYDVRGIQEYVFGGNRLKENLGASYLVHATLRTFLEGAVALAGGASIDWSGGGNAVVLSVDKRKALDVARRLSARLHHEAPGLSVACAHVEWTGADEDYPQALGAAHALLEERKSGALPEASFDGHGVTELCRSTGEPAIATDADRGGFLGPSTVVKVQAAKDARERLRALYALPADLDYSDETDELGRTEGERSFVGVIHFDGNNMGDRFKAASASRDRLKALSAQVNATGEDALRDTIDWVVKNLETIQDRKKGGFSLATSTAGATILPLRPIVFGGDDITLVCDARIALDVAVTLLGRWNARSAQHLGKIEHACAGVALVKSHYPFYRAYRLAEELCKSAKSYVRESGPEGSALDYTIHTGGPIAPLHERRMSDVAGPASLFARPYVIADARSAPAYRRWEWFRGSLLKELQTDERWTEFHTQLRGLAPKLRAGQDAARSHLDRWRDRFMKNLPSPPAMNLADSGFLNNETPYLDALELMDLLVSPECFPIPPAGGAP